MVHSIGKLQTLDGLLRKLKAGGHRVLIFTQMTRVLDVLEAFLSMHGHAYLRLDGSTRVEQRLPLVERFNADARVFAFILSTRSGGVGLNLTGADAVVFYDSDWNPTMDAQVPLPLVATLHHFCDCVIFRFSCRVACRISFKKKEFVICFIEFLKCVRTR